MIRLLKNLFRPGNETKISIKNCPLPGLLILDIAHSCNLKCRICNIWQTGKDEKDIECSYVKETLRQAAGLGIKEIALSGGEALLRKDIFEIIEFSQGIGIKDLGILSNGIMVCDKLDMLKPYLISRAVSLVISLDSLRPELHNQIRNSGEAWEKTVRALKALSELKREYGQINFNIISIILDQNLEELSKIAEFARSLGSNSLQFQALLANNLMLAERRKSAYWVKEERLALLDTTIDNLIRYKRSNPQFIKNSENNLSLVKKYFRGQLRSEDARCKSADDTVLISNQGTCTTCFSCYGDIKKKNLNHILQSAKRVAAQKKVKECSWPCLLPCFCDH